MIFLFRYLSHLFITDDNMNDMESQRNISEFILLGLSSDQNIQTFCFVLFSFCYIGLLIGNFLILISIKCSPLFQKPMYYFLNHLSSMDICYTSSVTPKLIGDLLVERKTISYGNCMFYRFFPCISLG